MLKLGSYQWVATDVHDHVHATIFKKVRFMSTTKSRIMNFAPQIIMVESIEQISFVEVQHFLRRLIFSDNRNKK